MESFYPSVPHGVDAGIQNLQPIMQLRRPKRKLAAVQFMIRSGSARLSLALFHLPNLNIIRQRTILRMSHPFRLLQTVTSRRFHQPIPGEPLLDIGTLHPNSICLYNCAKGTAIQTTIAPTDLFVTSGNITKKFHTATGDVVIVQMLTTVLTHP